MNSIASIFWPLFGIRAERDSVSGSVADHNDPAEQVDLLGTVCDVHGCPRMLDEAPVVPSQKGGRELFAAKRRLFPHSWNAVASIAPKLRGGWFQRSRRPKMIVVRYCEECRVAAEQWMEEHVDA
jgi:hypothetical protein